MNQCHPALMSSNHLEGPAMTVRRKLRLITWFKEVDFICLFVYLKQKSNNDFFHILALMRVEKSGRKFRSQKTSLKCLFPVKKRALSYILRSLKVIPLSSHVALILLTSTLYLSPRRHPHISRVQINLARSGYYAGLKIT